MRENATTLLAQAGLGRRLAAMLYESILLFALLLLAGFFYIPIFGSVHGPFQKAAFQFYLLMVMMIYFVVFWKRGGQTLAMKTWHIRLVRLDGKLPSTPQCIVRFSLATLGLLCAGAGFLWALIDPERQFLHDRLCRTRLIRTE
ncbi:MAG: RDD family protein [Pseudomonadota bacterium]